MSALPNLSSWAIKHRSLVLFFMGLLAIAGAYSYLNLGRNEDPTFTIKVMVVTAAWPGATAEEMEKQVADPIEAALQTVPHLDRIETYAKPGFVASTVILKDSTSSREVPFIWYLVRKKITDMRASLPQGVIGPQLNDEYADVFITVYTLTGDGASQRDLVEKAEYIRQQLLRLQDVEKVEIYGERKRKIFVEFSHTRLATLGVSPQAIFDALQRQNALLPAGSIETTTERIPIRLTGTLQGLDAVRAVPVAVGTRSLRLGDIATVSEGFEDPPSFVARFNGEPTISFGVNMARGGNVIKLGERLDAEIAKIRAELPAGIELHQVSNQPEVVEEAIGEFLFKFFMAVTIVLLVSFASLGFRTGIVVALSVPLTLAVTFLVMYMVGIDLHRISLGALIISLGLLVDDAIIAVEMMVVKLEQGFDRARAAAFAWEATAFPMLTGTLVTAAGFLPVGFAKSSAGEYAGGIFWVLLITLIISWFVAVICIPYLGYKLLPDFKNNNHQAAENPHAIYETANFQKLRNIILWAVNRRWTVIGGTVGLFILAGIGMGFVQQQFFPSSTRPELLVELSGPESASFTLTDAKAREIEAFIKGDPNLKYYLTTVGSGVPRFVLTYNPALPNPNYAIILIQTKGVKEREKLAAKLNAHFSKQEDIVRVRVSQLEMGPPSGFPVQFRVIGDNPDKVRDIAADVRAVMRGDKRILNAEFNWGERGKTVVLEIDQERARLMGVDRQSIALALQTLLSGYEVTQVRENNRQIGVVARAVEEERLSLEKLSDLVIATPDGKPLSVAQVARVRYASEEPIIWRRNRDLVMTVRADVVPGVQPPDVTVALMGKLEPISNKLPAGYRIEAGGAYEESAKANTALYAVFPLMFITMLALIMIQVQSFSRMFLVFATFPLGIIGAVAALLLTHSPFGFVALLGVIALGGMIMRNALILVDQIDQDLASGHTMREAIVEATVRRSRPVILTALAAALAFIPLTFNVLWGPMAIAMIGGLVVATGLTLVFLPALYAAWFRVETTQSH